MAERSEDRAIRPENLRDVLEAMQGVDLAALLDEGEARTERVEFRLTPSEKSLLQMLMLHTGVSMTKLVVALAGIAASGMTPKQKSKIRSKLVFMKPADRKSFGVKRKD